MDLGKQLVRTRFAPSPTGGLHIGGLRTALYNYLYAKKYGGKFILRIEDTDQARYVEGAEQYIIDALSWAGIIPDQDSHLAKENDVIYRQSEYKALYQKYAQILVNAGHAYYAFDTEEDLQKMKAEAKPYDYKHRNEGKNSLTLSPDETQALRSKGSYVVRFRNIPDEKIKIVDEIRGEIVFDSSLMDDRILLKSDGMPTYHLAVVVDDYRMKITHVFRGEEWLSSLPLHVKIWEKLGWQDSIPKWVHLPLILSPSGQGKLSKREAQKLDIPIFPLDWKDNKSNEQFAGFKSLGFLPEAVFNILALMGWSDGGEDEIMSKETLISRFSLDNINKSPAKFDYEKACWINHKYLISLPADELGRLVMPYIPSIYQNKFDSDQIKQLATMVIERCHLLSDFWKHSFYFFESPTSYALEAVKSSWNETMKNFFLEFAQVCNQHDELTVEAYENQFKSLATKLALKAGKVMLPFRIALVGGKFGYHLFDICAFIGTKEVTKRIESFVAALESPPHPTVV